MIIRILGEGQVVVPREEFEGLNELDTAVEAAALAGDQAALTAALSSFLGRVREVGQPLEDDIVVESDLILPDETATVADIVTMLDETSDYQGIFPA